jgi:transposase
VIGEIAASGSFIQRRIVAMIMVVAELRPSALNAARRLALSPGEAHDVRLAGRLLSRLKSGSMLLADRGYDADWIRQLAMKKGAWANIPPKSNRSDPICFSPYLYRARNQVERFFNRIKQSFKWHSEESWWTPRANVRLLPSRLPRRTSNLARLTPAG